MLDQQLLQPQFLDPELDLELDPKLAPLNCSLKSCIADYNHFESLLCRLNCLKYLYIPLSQTLNLYLALSFLRATSLVKIVLTRRKPPLPLRTSIEGLHFHLLNQPTIDLLASYLLSLLLSLLRILRILKIWTIFLLTTTDVLHRLGIAESCQISQRSTLRGGSTATGRITSISS